MARSGRRSTSASSTLRATPSAISTQGRTRSWLDDKSEEHNFHLTGTGVDQVTPIELLGTFTWTVTFTDANYTFRCDAHPTLMTRTFGVGNAPPPTTTTTTTPKPPPVKLLGTVGPGSSISLKKSSGAAAKTLPAKKYTVSVRDLSKVQNFHLIGPGVNRSTGVGFTGRASWTITLKKGTYRFQSDPNRARLHGSIRVT